MEAAPPVIGVISDCPLQRHILQKALQNIGFNVLINCDPSRLDDAAIERGRRSRAWVIDLKDEERWTESIDCLIDVSKAPILFGLGPAPNPKTTEFANWERRFYGKLQDLVGSIETLSEHGETLDELNGNGKEADKVIPLPSCIAADYSSPVARIWILGASLGGPAAIKDFLDCLPKGLPVAFVYAQHIDANSAGVLVRVLGRHSNFNLREAEAGATLNNGEVVIMPIEQELIFDAAGRFVLRNQPWPGPYGPSIDQVMLNVAGYYNNRAHAILFSGMGNDGAVAGPTLRSNGSHIWAQDSNSCANSSMPDSVYATGCVSYRGTPEQLAEKLIRTIEWEELSDQRQLTQ